MTVGLLFAAILILVTLHQLLLRAADAATHARAAQIGQVLSTEGLRGVDAPLLATAHNVTLIQVIDSHGVIQLTNDERFGRPMARPMPPGERSTLHGTHGDATDEEFQATALGVASPQGPMTVVVGAAESPINWTVLIVAILCCIVFPVIVILMAVLTHHFVGRTLRPVMAIVHRVGDITGGDLDQRVPVPNTDDEIATLARTMNAMLDRIESARAQQLQFVGDASHELNSPLTTLVGLLDLARTKNTAIEPATIETVMLPDALRLQQMVADLLLLARADERGVPLRVGDVDLDDIVSAEATRLAALSPHTVEAHIVAARVRGDGEKLTRALRNIADNAGRHAMSTVTFTMAVDSHDATVTITVTDDGDGIPDDDKHRVTERFVRLESARDRGSGGSGLGLAIVAEIVRAHHGGILIADAPEGGATVGFTLPSEAR
ncbi:HAMP domain-containing protein [Gordonia sp. TBRC 11910]|uniref:histidine kinase n=2 Tax=Gordonia asplenii TaxID=2725283 RepID=A0A848KZ29_9ACTN|nr:ATP-binding protein [Gordonia asplenii]NMO03649.1 HAMP domain-containing protein [Gordonia asplenii]